MIDPWETYAPSLIAGAENAAEITPDDNTDLAIATRALWIGETGDLKLTMLNGDTVILRNVDAGILPVRVRRVHETGTTATGIVALW